MALAVVLLAASPALAEEALIETLAPSPMPDVVMNTEKEVTIPLSENLGKLTLVHFWATWCVPCIDEFPKLDALQKQYGERGLKVIALSMDGERNTKKVRDFFTQHKIVHLTPYFDIKMSVFQSFKGRGVPTTFFVDAKGNIIARSEGPLEWNEKPVIDLLEAQLTP